MKKIEIYELSDLIGNAELTEKYFRSYPELKEKYSLPSVEACILENLQHNTNMFSPPVMQEWQERGYAIETLLDILPKGVIIPTGSSQGSVVIHTNNDHTFQHSFHCARHKAVPLKKPDEVYLIFPLTILGDIVLDNSALMDRYLFIPVWDVIAVPNYLLSDDDNNPHHRLQTGFDIV